ncbi:MAG: hypothetical protein GY796_03675, partial [Chloroflexi bacterium]|nr:hypothetical protein [Chloroflexota bacterium]
MKTLVSKTVTGVEIDGRLLQTFERNLDPQNPERNKVPSRVLGYGEISTVFEILQEPFLGLALKRMSIFETAAELTEYLAVYDQYHTLLEEEVGIHLPVQGYVALENDDDR